MSLNSELLYERKQNPFGLSWEKWAALWCQWMLSIPTDQNPSLDETGKYCSLNQKYQNVWFLTGTFGNTVNVQRRCSLPSGKAIFFPMLEKEDSLADDSDLTDESDLIKRSREATDQLIFLEASLDGINFEHLQNYRVQTEVFDLVYPKNNVYDVSPGPTRAVCDGYWLFIKPLHTGRHILHFKGETALIEDYTLSLLRRNDVYNKIHDHLEKNLTFKLEVTYQLDVLK